MPEVDIDYYKVLRLSEVTHLLSVSKTQLMVWIHAGEFPTPIKSNEKSIRFWQREVIAWLESRPRLKLKNGPAPEAAE